MTTEPTPVHVPHRPGWRCRACEAEWPCVRRKDELVRDAHRNVAVLTSQMTEYFRFAVKDMPEVPAFVLSLRFIAWVQPHVDEWVGPRPSPQSAQSTVDEALPSERR